MKIEKFNKNDIEFSKNLLNEPSETILSTLSSNKLKHLMLILPNLIKKNILPNNLDLSHIEDDVYVFAISGSEFQFLKEKGIKLSQSNINFCFIKALKDRNIEDVDIFIKEVDLDNENIKNLFLNHSNYKIIYNDFSIYTKVLCKYFDFFEKEVQKFGIKNIIRYNVKSKKYEALDLVGNLILDNKIDFLENHSNYFIKAITRLDDDDYLKVIQRSEIKKYQKNLFKEAVLHHAKEKINLLLENGFIAKDFINSKAFVNIANGKSLVSTSLLKNNIINLNKELKVITQYKEFEEKYEIKNKEVKRKKI